MGFVACECGYAVYVEFGTGVKGKGSPHPDVAILGWKYDVNNHGELLDKWETLMTVHTTAKQNNLATWFFIKIPNLDKGVAFTGEPSAMGVPAAEVNSVYSTNVYITPTGEPQWVEDMPTIE